MRLLDISHKYPYILASGTRRTTQFTMTMWRPWGTHCICTPKPLRSPGPALSTGPGVPKSPGCGVYTCCSKLRFPANPERATPLPIHNAAAWGMPDCGETRVCSPEVCFLACELLPSWAGAATHFCSDSVNLPPPSMSEGSRGAERDDLVGALRANCSAAEQVYSLHLACLQSSSLAHVQRGPLPLGHITGALELSHPSCI